MAYTFSSAEIALLAADVEQASAAFYQNLAHSAIGLPSGELFTTLSDQERAHERSFRAIAKVFQSRDGEYEYSIDLYAIMHHILTKLKAQAFQPSLAKRPRELGEALTLALDSEETAVKVYTEMRRNFTAEFHEVLDGIILVEGDHCRMVKELKEKLKG
jgi:rubrerythrin